MSTKSHRHGLHLSQIRKETQKDLKPEDSNGVHTRYCSRNRSGFLMLLPQHAQYVPPGSGTLCTGTAVVTGSVPSSGGESGSGSSAASWSVTGPVWRQVFAIAPEVASSGCLDSVGFCVCASAVDGILYSFLQLWTVSCIHFFKSNTIQHARACSYSQWMCQSSQCVCRTSQS